MEFSCTYSRGLARETCVRAYLPSATIYGSLHKPKCMQQKLWRQVHNPPSLSLLPSGFRQFILFSISFSRILLHSSDASAQTRKTTVSLVTPTSSLCFHEDDGITRVNRSLYRANQNTRNYLKCNFYIEFTSYFAYFCTVLLIVIIIIIIPPPHILLAGLILSHNHAKINC